MGELSTIQFHVSHEVRPYTGVELRPHYLLSEMGIRGSAVSVFTGPCHVKTEHLVDWEDKLAHDRIDAKEMVSLHRRVFRDGSQRRRADATVFYGDNARRL